MSSVFYTLSITKVWEKILSLTFVNIWEFGAEFTSFLTSHNPIPDLIFLLDTPFSKMLSISIFLSLTLFSICMKVESLSSLEIITLIFLDAAFSVASIALSKRIPIILDKLAILYEIKFKLVLILRSKVNFTYTRPWTRVGIAHIYTPYGII